MDILPVKNRSEFRAWLALHHAEAAECWVAVKSGEPKAGALYYLDAVEEALCFGWIDSVKYKLDAEHHIMAQRFSPRKKNSPWSELNKERCRRLERLGLMTDAGRAVLPDMDAEFVVFDEIKNLIESDPVVKANFAGFPPLYQRIRLNSIQRECSKPEIYERMKRNFMEKTREGKMYGAWTDFGRLYP
ncbi:MAG TPA: YdeI/OmpD-associated family protein [Methanocorpusculum sp.]|nr:YdeI/OmpD-associated family protein [Methanocorpusculum sp.]